MIDSSKPVNFDIHNSDKKPDHMMLHKLKRSKWLICTTPILFEIIDRQKH